MTTTTLDTPVSKTHAFWMGVESWDWDEHDQISVSPTHASSHASPTHKEIPMSFQTMKSNTALLERRAALRTAHRDIDPNSTCPQCKALRAKMARAAVAADAFCTNRFGGSNHRGTKAWKNAYIDALGA